MTNPQMPPPNRNAAPAKAPKRRKGFNWGPFLIESAIAILIFNIIAGILTYYFILPKLKH